VDWASAAAVGPQGRAAALRRGARCDRGSIRRAGRRARRGVAALLLCGVRAAERDVSRARQLRAELSEIGRAVGRDRTTAAHACRLIKGRRDDPAVDAVLGQLESACCALRRRMNPAVQP
jgi:hypothetical protein